MGTSLLGPSYIDLDGLAPLDDPLYHIGLGDDIHSTADRALPLTHESAHGSGVSGGGGGGGGGGGSGGPHSSATDPMDWANDDGAADKTYTVLIPPSSFSSSSSSCSSFPSSSLSFSAQFLC